MKNNFYTNLIDQFRFFHIIFHIIVIKLAKQWFRQDLPKTMGNLYFLGYLWWGGVKFSGQGNSKHNEVEVSLLAVYQLSCAMHPSGRMKKKSEKRSGQIVLSPRRFPPTPPCLCQRTVLISPDLCPPFPPCPVLMAWSHEIKMAFFIVDSTRVWE